MLLKTKPVSHIIHIYAHESVHQNIQKYTPNFDTRTVQHRNTEHDAHSHVHTLTSSLLLVLEGCRAGLRPTGLEPVYSRLKSFVGEVASLTPDILGLGGYWVPGR